MKELYYYVDTLMWVSLALSMLLVKQMFKYNHIPSLLKPYMLAILTLERLDFKL